MNEVRSVAELLAAAQSGDDATITRLLPLVYDELKALAGSYLSRSPGHTLQPTALVHEAYMKLVGGDKAWSGRDHFIATAAKAMRQVLVDHARRKHADKRGGSAANKADVSIDTIVESKPMSGDGSREMRVLELDDLLTRLAGADPRAARIAEMRLFGGMNQEQIAGVLGISRSTVVTDWEFARAWLAGKAKAGGA